MAPQVMFLLDSQTTRFICMGENISRLYAFSKTIDSLVIKHSGVKMIFRVIIFDMF